mgnify:CR=1 FL=1
MLDLTKPINISVITIIVSFLASLGILHLARPSWLLRLNNQGKAEISTSLIISYSITFALVCGVAALILSSKKTDTDNKLGNPPPMSTGFI